MFEGIVRLGHRLVGDFGLPGLFFFSFASATIFVPVSVEWLFPLMVMAGANKLLVLAAATIGGVLGALLNYYIGFAGMKLVNRYIKRVELKRAHEVMNRYGWLGLFGALILPLPGDSLTVLCGMTRMHVGEFTLVVTLAKALKYAMILGLLSVILGQ